MFFRVAAGRPAATTLECEAQLCLKPQASRHFICIVRPVLALGASTQLPRRPKAEPGPEGRGEDIGLLTSVLTVAVASRCPPALSCGRGFGEGATPAATARRALVDRRRITVVARQPCRRRWKRTCVSVPSARARGRENKAIGSRQGAGAVALHGLSLGNGMSSSGDAGAVLRRRRLSGAGAVAIQHCSSPRTRSSARRCEKVSARSGAKRPWGVRLGGNVAGKHDSQSVRHNAFVPGTRTGGQGAIAFSGRAGGTRAL
ncbi:hypothetical protein ERJ75_001155600 [Trypanosoma vivax]|nr:hypothetical protein ERJ75_001155600 [Trypanosoma vivax]